MFFFWESSNQSKDLEKMAQEIGDKSMVATPSIVDIDEQEEIFQCSDIKECFFGYIFR